MASADHNLEPEFVRCVEGDMHKGVTIKPKVEAQTVKDRLKYAKNNQRTVMIGEC